MATTDEKGLFWDSQGGDRKYSAESFEKWLRKFFTTGVFVGDCAVTAGSGMAVSMAGGYVNINGKVRLFEGATALTLEMSDSTNPRIDTVVVERNDNDREITAKVVTGTPGATPTATAPVRTDSIYQLIVAEVYVGAGVSSVTDANITDRRDNATVCGVIQCTVNNFAYGTEDLTAGTSPLETGTFYFQYD